MDFNEYKPKGFSSWQSYRKWQHFCDITGVTIVGIILVMTVYNCGG